MRNFLFYILSMSALLWSCAEKPISQLTPEEGIARIREERADKDYEKVINDVNEYRSRYPYSQFAAEAEMAQADSYYDAGRYSEAVATYEEFTRKFPKQPKTPYAWFRIGASYDREAPEEIDREQDFALKAIARYGTFLEKFPNTEWTTEAKQRVEVLSRRVAEHFVFIARFYWKKELYQGALTRYLQVIERYGNFRDLRDEAVERAALCYRELASLLAKDPKSDKVSYFRNSSPEALNKLATEMEAKKSKGPF